jgi:futalosine hydrolase
VRLLIVAATAREVAPFVARLGPGRVRNEHLVSFALDGKAIDLLTCGIGMVPTAAWCARTLALGPYDLALNLGVCGSFDPRLRPGQVVHVVRDRLAELGAEDGERLLSIEEMGLAGEAECCNRNPPANEALERLPAVCGITVNTVHGSERTIAAVVERFHPQVESMEGAAFMYASASAGVPYAQVRAVSNVVERRNRTAWRLAEAIDSLARTARLIVDAA